MEKAARSCHWGHWWIEFWEGDIHALPTSSDPQPRKDSQLVARLPFAVGPCGPVDGTLGSPTRLQYREYCRLWTLKGELPTVSNLEMV